MDFFMSFFDINWANIKIIKNIYQKKKDFMILNRIYMYKINKI